MFTAVLALRLLILCAAPSISAFALVDLGLAGGHRSNMKHPFSCWMPMRFPDFLFFNVASVLVQDNAITRLGNAHS